MHPHKSALVSVKTSQNQNVPSDLPKRPIFGESKRPKYVFTIFNQTRDSKHFLSQSQNVPSQNVPKSKCRKSKGPRVKMSQVKTSQSQNVPSQNVPESKCPRVKTSQVKTSQVKTSQSQNVPSCLSACKQHYSHSYEVIYWLIALIVVLLSFHGVPLVCHLAKQGFRSTAYFSLVNLGEPK